MKYKIVKESKALPEGWHVGHILENVYHHTLWIVENGLGTSTVTNRHLNALKELGVVEEVKEVKEWNPRELVNRIEDEICLLMNEPDIEVALKCSVRDNYTQGKRDAFIVAYYEAKEYAKAAEAWRDKILKDYDNL